MNESIKVSVVIATYKRDKDLKRALESLAGQTYKGFEVVIVDDSAESEWQQKVREIVKLTEPSLNIKLITNEKNLGSAASRNEGIKNSSGEYITFLDDDDIYLPKKIECQLEDVIKSGADYALTDLYLYKDNGEIAERRTREYIKKYEAHDLLRYHLLYHMTGTDTFMFKKEYLQKIGGFPPIDVGDEFYLMEQAILNGGKCCYSPHCYVKAYIHTGEEGGLSSGQGKIDGENALHEEKKKHFYRLSRSDIRQINARHYAVLAFAKLRLKQYPAFAINAAKAAFISPAGCVKILKKRI